MSAPKASSVKGPRSEARLSFFTNSDVVRSLWALHQQTKDWSPARRRHLGVANQGVYLLVAALWETYCEDLLLESLELLVQGVGGPDALPLRLRRQLAEDVREDRHELAPSRLAGDGWRTEAMARAEQVRRALAFNSPKAAHVDGLFDRHLGLHGMSTLWPEHRGKSAGRALDEHLARRGALAHRAGEVAVSKADVSDFYELVSALTLATDATVGEHLRVHTGNDPFAELRSSDVPPISE